MNAFHLILLVSALAAPVPALGEPGERDRRDHDFAGMFLKRADRDGDGAVSREEFLGLERLQRMPEDKRAGIFRRLDKDDDGFVRKGELEGLSHQERGRRPMPRLKELDTNDDGGIDYDEFAASPFVQRLPEDGRRRFFNRLDRDDDGRITPRDHPRPGGQDDDRHPGKGPHRMDCDEDGAVSFEEFQQAPSIRDLSEDEQEDKFEALDSDGDLQLKGSEIPRGPRPKPGPAPEENR